MVCDCVWAMNNENVWMACETEGNALKSEETEYLTDKKYPVSKLRAVD